MTKFFDSAFHLDSIPDKSDVMLYIDGSETGYQAHYPYHRFGQVRWITVLGTGDAGACDYEPGNPIYSIPGALRNWVKVRQARKMRSRIYCSRANLGRAYRELGATPGTGIIWWIPTLDNDASWTAAKLSADVKREENIVLPAGQIWAVQYAGGPTAKVDTSILLGKW